jgi:hypothetical protein
MEEGQGVLEALEALEVDQVLAVEQEARVVGLGQALEDLDLVRAQEVQTLDQVQEQLFLPISAKTQTETSSTPSPALATEASKAEM